MKNLFFLLLIFCALPLDAQTDKREVRAGNRKFAKEDYAGSEIDYRKALLRDSLSIAGLYNLASALYRQGGYDAAAEALGKVPSEIAEHPRYADYNYNAGDIALQRKDYAAAVEAFRQSLLLNPGDIDAKENYLYAKMMLKNSQNGGGGQDNQNQQNKQDEQNQQEKQEKQEKQENPQQDQQDQQNQQDNPQQPQEQPQDGQQISPQQARRLLNAVQAQEKKTMDKVRKEKAALLRSQQKEKNW